MRRATAAALDCRWNFVDPKTLLGLAALAATLVAWMAVRAERLTPFLALFSLVFLVAAMAWGELIALFVERRPDAVWELPLTIVVGTIALGALIFVAVCVGLSPGVSLVASMLLAVSLRLWSLLRGIGGTRLRTRTSRLGLLALLFAILGTTLWVRPHFRPWQPEAAARIYRVWDDAFIHAGMVALLERPGGPLRVGDMQMAGRPLPWYHYASYSVPAAAAGLCDLTALEAVNGLWTPLGFLLVPLLVFGGGARLRSAEAGVGGLVASLLLPDASFYGLKVPYLSAHWLLQISGSLAWGIATAGIGVLLGVVASRVRSLRVAAAAFLFAVSSVLFKAQIAVVSLPLLLAWLVFAWTGLRWSSRAAFAATLGGAGVTAAFMLQGVPGVPTFRAALAGPSGRSYLQFLLGQMENEPLKRWLIDVYSSSSGVERLAWGAGVVVAGSFGLLLVAYMVLVAFRLYRRVMAVTDWLPVLVVVVQLVLSLGLAANEKGNPFELQHRTFVWSYVLIAAWCGFHTGAWFESSSASRAARAVGLGLCGALLVVPVVTADEVRGARTSPAANHLDIEVPLGLIGAARFLRATSHPLAVVQDGAEDRSGILLGLGERRAYLARPQTKRKLEHAEDLLRERRGRLGELISATTSAELETSCRRSPFDWLVLPPAIQVSWPVDPVPAYESHGYRVFNLDSLCVRPATAVRSGRFGYDPTPMAKSG